MHGPMNVKIENRVLQRLYINALLLFLKYCYYIQLCISCYSLNFAVEICVLIVKYLENVF